MPGLFGTSEFFGLDVGSSAIRLVQLRNNSGRYNLVSYAETKIPIGLSQSDSPMDVKQVSQVIKKLVHDARVSTRNVVSALSGSSVYNVVVKMPQMAPNEIEKAIQWQAEQNIPLKLEDVRISWQLISPSVGPNKEIAVMIVAAPNAKIERTMSTLEGADLKVVGLETIPVALTRSLGQTGGSRIMIIDIGASNTEIAIMQDEILFHSRTLPVASFAFTRALSQNLGLDINQAEQFKRKFGLSQDKLEGELFKTLQPLLSGIVEEIKRSIKFYQEQFGQNIDRIILSGGSARLPEFPAYLSSFLEIDVQIANPWATIGYPASIQQNLINSFAEYSTAIGLAKRK